MATSDPRDGAPAAPLTAAAGASPPNGSAEGPTPGRHRGPWLWVSLVLGALAIGLLVWGLAKSSDLNSAQDQLDKQADAGQSVASTAQTAYQDVTKDLNATNQQLDATTQDVQTANDAADQAQKDADAAKKQADQASDQTEKAQAQAAEAQAQTKVAESKAEVVTDCAKAYMSTIGTLFDGSDIKAQAATIGEKLSGISADCKAAFQGA